MGESKVFAALVWTFFRPEKLFIKILSASLLHPFPGFKIIQISWSPAPSRFAPPES